MKTEVVIRNGRILDPATGTDRPGDLVLSDGKILGLEESGSGDAEEVFDASGKLVVPGLMDVHAHVADTVISLCVNPDDTGVAKGITTVCDAGSCGYLNFPAFRKYVIESAVTDVYALLHVSPFGEAVLPETGYDIFDERRFLAVVEEHRDVIRGVKLRLIGEILDETGLDVMEAAFGVAEKAGLPVVVHTGFDNPANYSPEVIRKAQLRLLSFMRKGDVLTHAFTPKPGGFFSGDDVPAELREAVDNGVLLDMTPGLGHFSFTVAGKAVEAGFPPSLGGTDVVRRVEPEVHFYSVTMVLSKMLALGIPLERVVAAATSVPAKVLGIGDRFGSLKPGMPADISILELKEGDFLLHDGAAGNVISSGRVLLPSAVFKAGREYPVDPAYGAHVPTREVILAAAEQRRKGS